MRFKCNSSAMPPVDPTSFIEQHPFNHYWLESYATRETPAQTMSLQRDRGLIGNASDFTTWLIAASAGNNVPPADQALLRTSWNLDADRGYGYKAWRGEIPSDEVNPVNNEVYV